MFENGSTCQVSDVAHWKQTVAALFMNRFDGL